MNGTSRTDWISKRPDVLPDFIIGGAMKSGTTSLHAILNQHPEVQIAHNELGFFDMDSIVNHPDFNFFDKKTKTWTVQSMKDNPDILWNWYHSQFEGIKQEGCILGEDSTTYLLSSMAAQRIAMQQKPIKLVFILRHPTKRTISNYLHLLKSGRAIYTLEDTLRYDPRSIIQRSLYKGQLANYYKHIPTERIKVVLFEDLVNEKESCLREICDFLGVDYNKFVPEALNVHLNKTKIPKSIKLQLLRNRLLRYYGDYRYSKFLPYQPESQRVIGLGHKVIDKIHKTINPLMEDIKFEPNPSTIEYLNEFFKTEMEGLDELVGKNITSRWSL